MNIFPTEMNANDVSFQGPTVGTHCARRLRGQSFIEELQSARRASA